MAEMAKSPHFGELGINRRILQDLLDLVLTTPTANGTIQAVLIFGSMVDSFLLLLRLFSAATMTDGAGRCRTRASG